jgi:hypothetical protein
MLVAKDQNRVFRKRIPNGFDMVCGQSAPQIHAGNLGSKRCR